jgi:hypothetical protein
VTYRMALSESGCNKGATACAVFPRNKMHWQNRLDRPRLSVSLRPRCRLQILVSHAEIRVTQVVADRQLMLAQFGQHRSCSMSERVPAHAGDSNFLECRPDLPLQDRGQIESLSTTVESRREHEIRRLSAVTLRSPFQHGMSRRGPRATTVVNSSRTTVSIFVLLQARGTRGDPHIAIRIKFT